MKYLATGVRRRALSRKLRLRSSTRAPRSHTLSALTVRSTRRNNLVGSVRLLRRRRNSNEPARWYSLSSKLPWAIGQFGREDETSADRRFGFVCPTSVSSIRCLPSSPCLFCALFFGYSRLKAASKRLCKKAKCQRAASLAEITPYQSDLESVCTLIAYRGFESHPVRVEVLILSVFALLGVTLNALFGWWWADPVAALGMVPIILKEGFDGIRGNVRCDDCAS